jgi:trimeric autotransporter adhesin
MNTMQSAHVRGKGFHSGAQRLRTLWLAGALLGGLSLTAHAEIYNVNVASDAPQDPATTTKCAAQGDTTKCSLRAAIMYGNTRAGSHTINFVGVTSITVINGGLPQMRAPYTVNGNRVVINGNGRACLDLTDSGTAAIGHADGATGSKIFNLTIGNCNGNGISANGHNYTFTGNYIGVNATGAIAMPNTGDGISLSASRVYPDTSSGFLSSLYAQFPVQPVDASAVNAFQSQLATTLASLQPVFVNGNVISGNGGDGIEIFSQNLAAVFVSGNMIGTDLTGNIAVANGGHGVNLTGTTFGNMIGPGNVISGNAGNGVNDVSGAVYLPNFIMANRIGLSAANQAVHIGNTLSGIYVDSKPDTSGTSFNPSFTAAVIGPANLISDNKGANNNAFPDIGADYAGVMITGASNGVKVIYNTIGLAEFPTGTPINSTAFGNKGDGIIVTTTGNSITGNTVSANARHGITVRGSSTNSTTITKNLVGISASFANVTTLGNGVDGIHIETAASTTVGGPNSNDRNVVVANKRNGIKLYNGGGDTSGWANLFQRNKVYGNAKTLAGVDIDLEHTANAADFDHSEFPANYANRDQNTPQICTGSDASGPCVGAAAPSNSGANTTARWTLTSHGPASFRMEFYAINAPTTTASTSMVFLGEQVVTTDATGKPTNGGACSAGRCTATIKPVMGGRRIVMTATDITALTSTPSGSGWQGALKCFLGNNGIILSACNANNTSEYSNVVTIAGGDVLFANGLDF